MGCRYASRQLRGLRGCSGRLAFVDAYDLPLLARQVSLPRPPQRLLGDQQRDDDAEDRRPYGRGLGVLERGQVEAVQAEAVERVSERRDGALRCRYVLRRVVHHPRRVALHGYTGQTETGYSETSGVQKKSRTTQLAAFSEAPCRQIRTLGLRAARDRPLLRKNSISRRAQYTLPLDNRSHISTKRQLLQLTRARGSTVLPDRSRLVRSTCAQAFCPPRRRSNGLNQHRRGIHPAPSCSDSAQVAAMLRVGWEYLLRVGTDNRFRESVLGFQARLVAGCSPARSFASFESHQARLRSVYRSFGGNSRPKPARSDAPLGCQAAGTTGCTALILSEPPRQRRAVQVPGASDRRVTRQQRPCQYRRAGRARSWATASSLM